MAITKDDSGSLQLSKSGEPNLTSNFDSVSFLYPEELPSWSEITETPHEAFYQDPEGRTYYIADTHEGRLRKTGKRYAAILSDSKGYHLMDEAEEPEELSPYRINMTIEEILGS